MVLVISPSINCELLPWDSEFFGMRIARLRGTHVSAATLNHARAWCADRAVECLYVLVDSGDAESRATLDAAAIPCVDERVTLERAVGPDHELDPLDGRIRTVRESDIAALCDIAAVSHRDSRFYADSHFAPERCDALYRTWIEKSCRGASAAVLVAVDARRQPVGYVTCDLPTPTIGQIGLIAVDPTARSAGVGAALVEAACGWLARRRRTTIRVVTQERNSAARRLYARAGFEPSRSERWYHIWQTSRTGAHSSHAA